MAGKVDVEGILKTLTLEEKVSSLHTDMSQT